MNNWIVTIYDSEHDIQVPAILCCESMEEANNFVESTKTFHQNTDYLSDMVGEYVIVRNPDGLMKLDMLVENGAVTEVAALKIDKKLVLNKEYVVCYRSYDFPAIYDVEDAEVLTDKLIDKYLSSHDGVEVDDYAYDDENGIYISIDFSDRHRIFAMSAKAKAIGNNKYYDPMEVIS